jgi:hypothetical protein
MKTRRTFSFDRLYHQFLSPKGIPMAQTPILAARLAENEFIDIYQDADNPDIERYSERQKLTERKHRDELFKIISLVGKI